MSEGGCQSFRCYTEAQNAVLLSSEALFQYTSAGKLSLSHVSSKTKLREVAMGFQGTGAERILQENAEGSKASSLHLCLGDHVIAEKKWISRQA